jgi:aminopeptidase N
LRRLIGLSLLLLALTACAADLRYDLILSVAADGALTGEATVTGIAPGDWTEAVFRLYPAATGADRLALRAASVDGEMRPWETVEPTVAVVPLSARAGQTFSLTLAFRGRVPELEDAGGYGIFARTAHSMTLAQAYPVLAPWKGEWQVEPAFPWGDAVVAAVADYHVLVEVPEGWTVVTSGREVEVGQGLYEAQGDNLREMMIVLLSGYEAQTASLAGVRLRSLAVPGHRTAGAAALAVAYDALQVYQELLGPCPFPELDLVEVPLLGAAGVEYPGLILAGTSYYERYSYERLVFPMIFAHEAAHQWWYAEVGSNQVAEPWVDEALATYTSGLYFAAQGRFQEILCYWQDAYRRARGRNREATVASPLSAFPGGEGYGGIVYSGGALFLHEVRTRMGDSAFFQALRRYRDEFRWDIAGGDDLLRILREGSPQPLDDLVQRWLGRP